MRHLLLLVDLHVRADGVQQLLRRPRRKLAHHLHVSSRRELRSLRLSGLPVDLCVHPLRLYRHRHRKTKKMMVRLTLALVREGGACGSTCPLRLLLAVAVVGLVDQPVLVGPTLTQKMTLVWRLDITHHQKTLQTTTKKRQLQQGEQDDRQDERLPLLHRQDLQAKHAQLVHLLVEEEEGREFRTRKSIRMQTTTKKAMMIMNRRRKR